MKETKSGTKAEVKAVKPGACPQCGETSGQFNGRFGVKCLACGVLHSQVTLADTKPTALPAIASGPNVCPACDHAGMFVSSAGKKCLRAECGAVFPKPLFADRHAPTRAVNPGSLSGGLMTSRGATARVAFPMA